MNVETVQALAGNHLLADSDRDWEPGGNAN